MSPVQKVQLVLLIIGNSLFHFGAAQRMVRIGLGRHALDSEIAINAETAGQQEAGEEQAEGAR